MDEEMLTYDDVVQIATEIAEQTVKTFFTLQKQRLKGFGCLFTTINLLLSLLK